MKLLLGNEAVAAGAIEGGATFFAGYPLALTSELDAAFLRNLPSGGGAVVLAEDAPAAIGAVLGAGAGGGIGVTALTGATLGAAEELLRFGMEQKLPAVVAVVGARVESPRRVECASQEEVNRLRFVASSGRTAPVWVPCSAQECFALARHAAGEARTRGTPVFLFLDDVVAHLREPVDAGRRVEPATAEAGPAPAELYRARDASVLVVAYGIVARAARTAVRLARDEGIRAGLFRPARLWPFPDGELLEAAARARSLLVAELNEGQLWEAIAARRGEGDDSRPILRLSERNEGMLPPQRILDAIRGAT